MQTVSYRLYHIDSEHCILYSAPDEMQSVSKTLFVSFLCSSTHHFSQSKIDWLPFVDLAAQPNVDFVKSPSLNDADVCQFGNLPLASDCLNFEHKSKEALTLKVQMPENLTSKIILINSAPARRIRELIFKSSE